MLKVAFIVPDNRDEQHCFRIPTPYFGPAPSALLEGFSQLDACEIHVVSLTHEVTRAPERLGRNIWFHTAVVPASGWLRGLYLGCVHATQRMLRRIQPDIVHGQGTERYCGVAAARSGYPNVLTIHGNMRLIARVNRARPFSFHWMAACLERWTIPKAGGVVCISTHTQRAVGSLARKTWLIPNAVEGNFFDVNRDQERGRPPTILFPALACALKNQINFIRALDSMPKPPNFRLVFLGGSQAGDEYSEEFEKTVKNRSWCVSMGFVTREKLRMLLPEATAVVLPSLEDNCPMAILEAMAAGVPVAGSRVGGIPDLIEEGVTGLLCDPTSSESMRQMVSQIIENPEASQRMAEHAQNLARLRFHPRIIAERHLQIYRELLQPTLS